MKLLVFLVAVVSLVQAYEGDVFPRHIDPITSPNLRKFLRSPHPRITGGEEAVPNSIPYQVGLFLEVTGGTAFCGGSLISQKTILTAAHCVDGASSVEVRLGAHRVQQNESSQVRVTSTNFTIHSGWNPLTLLNDIALINLASAVNLTDNIKLATLPSRSDVSNNFLNDLSTVSGWGLDADSSTTISPVLRKVDVPVGSNLLCNIYYLGSIADSHICTSGLDGKSTCSGDSGGPLVSSTGKQIGLVSFGIALGCEVGWPSAYTRITSFVDWIQQNSDVVIL